MSIYPEGMYDYVLANVKGKTQVEITKLVNDHFGTEFTVSQIRWFKKNHKLSSGLTGYFEKGHQPVNPFPKGHYPVNAFPKGHESFNKLPIGTEILRGDRYIWIKTGMPNIWRQKHVVLWEKHNGKRPNRCKIIFLDGDKSNISIENLAMVNDAELLIMNRNGLIKNEKELTQVGVNIAKVMHKVHKIKKGKENAKT